MKKKLIQIWMHIRWPYDWLMMEIAYRKKLKRLKEQDPFIYD